MKLFGKKRRIIRQRAECIYGPPEMLEKRRYGKDTENVPEDIYGPPEMLGALNADNKSDTTEEAEVPPEEEDDDK